VCCDPDAICLYRPSSRRYVKCADEPPRMGKSTQYALW